MRFFPLLTLFLLTTAPTLAADDGSRLHFPATGFSIEPLEAATAPVASQPLTMALPAAGGFAPNVNVAIQPFGGSMQDYLDLSLRQFEAAGIEVIDKKVVSENTVSFEYAGSLRGRDLHWYASATQDGNRVFLVTATAPESRWKDSADKLKAVVRSFRLEGSP